MSATQARITDHIETLIATLDTATAAYRTTGDTLLDTQATLDSYRRSYAEHEAHIKAVLLADPDLGKNAEQRAANLAVRLAESELLAVHRADLVRATEEHAEAERAHKNAYHLMESTRVALAALSAILRGGN